jgi:predicted aminopeptidase
MRKKILIFVALVLLLFSAVFSDMLFYLYRQAAGQIRILKAMRPVEEVLADREVADTVKEKIRLIAEIKKFGEEKIGFPETKNYTYFYEHNGKPLLWVITASEEFALKEYEWTFPFLGSVSYKGFFDTDLLEKEKEKLEKLGLETDVREVAAWSTLGILPDPILSSMLQRNEFRLADLIFHENTHVVYYAPDGTEYNENLADYVAKRCTEFYLKEKYPENPEVLENYRLYLKDRETLRNFLKRSTENLQNFFGSLPSEMPIEEKRKVKKNKLESLTKELRKEHFADTSLYDYFDDKLPNNAFWVGFLQYGGMQDYFDSLYAQKSAPEIIELLKDD